MPLVTIENLKFKSAAHHYGFITFIAMRYWIKKMKNFHFLTLSLLNNSVFHVWVWRKCQENTIDVKKILNEEIIYFIEFWNLIYGSDWIILQLFFFFFFWE